MKISENCLTQVPVTVLGSGASCAHGIRGMGELADYLVAHVAPKPEDQTKWDVFKVELSSKRDLEETLQRVEISEHLLRQVINCTQKMIREDELPIYHRIVTNELTLGLSCLFRHLFRTTHRVVNVVTTNYDRLAEFAANHASYACNTGFSEGVIRQFCCAGSDPNLYKRQKNFRCVDIWKVHGSIDWYRNDNHQPTALLDSIAAGNRFDSLIVTPGVGKYSATHQEPFRSVIACADLALSSARGFLCVGYGFNDSHIEPKLIQRTIDLRVPVVIIARSLRGGAKEFLERHMGANVVAFERSGNDTIAYCSLALSGIVLKDEELWNLEGLLLKLGVT